MPLQAIETIESTGGSTRSGAAATPNVVAQRRVFIGSINLDPRSENINSEMGVVIDSDSLAAELAQAMERDMAPANAWHVYLDDAGEVRWAAAGQVQTRQPARSGWQRVMDFVFMAFPRDLY